MDSRPAKASFIRPRGNTWTSTWKQQSVMIYLSMFCGYSLRVPRSQPITLRLYKPTYTFHPLLNPFTFHPIQRNKTTFTPEPCPYLQERLKE
ncbi:hypothetical protein E4T38_08976 [Aureobasidium subglaciale]|nr:hypothetical protein E4T38_08976 [Aureobasidium subglaciale]KAI5214554.1 hypothetical protein E4T40_08936 [Aureobasidium subglaciale]KAI5217282.1 hypothetical protein E4T41_08895 [Aureobasidium subglaciale]KAI5254999.1 hypothetical protein E4T46_08929 [Aureobasidium subglaciale]